MHHAASKLNPRTMRFSASVTLVIPASYFTTTVAVTVAPDSIVVVPSVTPVIVYVMLVLSSSIFSILYNLWQYFHIF